MFHKDFCVQNFITITLIEATIPLIEDQKNVQCAGRKVTSFQIQQNEINSTFEKSWFLLCHEAFDFNSLFLLRIIIWKK